MLPPPIDENTPLKQRMEYLPILRSLNLYLLPNDELEMFPHLSSMSVLSMATPHFICLKVKVSKYLRSPINIPLSVHPKVSLEAQILLNKAIPNPQKQQAYDLIHLYLNKPYQKLPRLSKLT